MMLAKANDANTKTRAIFLLAAKKPPYAVYCNPFYDYAGYGNVFSVNSSGHLDKNIQNFEYCDKTAIHGMVFDPSETHLYSADMWANRIWCHRKIEDEGKVETVGYTEAPAPKDHPRWVEIHPSGHYLYALMEGGNRLCEYVIDPKTKLPVYTHKTYPLIPPGTRPIQRSKRLHADPLRYSECDDDVPLRRLFPYTIVPIPVRDFTIEFLLAHRIHRRLQSRAIRCHRASDLPQSHTNFRWTFERSLTLSVER